MHTNFWVDEDELARMFSEKCSLHSAPVVPFSTDEAIAIALSNSEEQWYHAQTPHHLHRPYGLPVAQPRVNINDDASYAYELYLLEAYELAKEDEALARGETTFGATDTTTSQDALQAHSQSPGSNHSSSSSFIQDGDVVSPLNLAGILASDPDDDYDDYDDYYVDYDLDDQVDVDNMTYEQLLELAERIGPATQAPPKGLNAHEIARIPTVCITRVTGVEKENQCAICMCEMEVGKEVRILPCTHKFHGKDCIDEWLRRSKKCPVCKSDVLGH